MRTLGSRLSRTTLTSPVVGGTVVGVVGAGVCGAGNLVAYARKKKTGREALVDTVKDGTGLGLAAGLGIGAANIVAATGLVLINPAVLPVATAVTVACAAGKTWNRLTSRNKVRRE